MNRKLKKYQIDMRRSNHGKVLGVFCGIAENQGWSVCLTRWVGVAALLMIAGAFGVDGFSSSVLAVGFFYLLIAMLMRPPLETGEYIEPNSHVAVRTPYGREHREVRPRVAAVPHHSIPGRRVDLGQLDRQLDSLNRRIQRMETIVTDRQYDWDRRMNGSSLG